MRSHQKSKTVFSTVLAISAAVLFASPMLAQNPQNDKTQQAAPNIIQLSVLYDHFEGCPSLSALLSFAPEGARLLSNQATPGHAKNLPILRFFHDGGSTFSLANNTCRYVMRVERQVLENGKWVASIPKHP